MSHLKRKNMINRNLQNEILTRLQDTYPNLCTLKLNDFTAASEFREVEFNFHYLGEHGLIQSIDIRHIDHIGHPMKQKLFNRIEFDAKITCKGIDFIQNDGGLTAILGTVTVKLHADTIRDLIDSKILQSEAIPEKEKPALREAIKGMKEEGLKQLTTRLISYGLDQGAVSAQQLWQWIGS